MCRDGHRVNPQVRLPSKHDGGEIWRAKEGFYVCMFVMFFRWIILALMICSVCLEGASRLANWVVSHLCPLCDIILECI